MRKSVDVYSTSVLEYKYPAHCSVLLFTYTLGVNSLCESSYADIGRREQGYSQGCLQAGAPTSGFAHANHMRISRIGRTGPETGSTSAIPWISVFI
jgi:hypothetical protein